MTQQRLILSLRRLFKASLIAVAMTVAVKPATAHAESSREFILSCSYGVLAGTLVGAATLAFSDKPGENLNKVARGASIGLYAGILLGLYVVYGDPGASDEDDEAVAHIPLEQPKMIVAPVIGERGLEGADVRYTVLNF